MEKKAQGLSLTVVIVAVLVLIVLIVLVLVFSGRLQIFSSKTSDTTAQYDSGNCKIPGTNNECVYSREDCESKGGSYRELEAGYEDCFGAQCCYM